MSDINEIYQRFLNRECTPAEVDLLMEHFRQQENATDILNLIQTQLDHEEAVIDEQDRVSAAHNWSRIESHIHSKSRVRKLKNFWWSAVACLFLLAIGVMFYFYKTNSFSAVDNVAKLTEPIKPGSNRATLTFADGSTVALSPTQGGVVVGETMTYDDGSTISSKKVTYATLATPRGGQYRVTLPDGTKVWLNAASSLQYPTLFDGDERKVRLTGEAYFEVAHKEDQPFVVETAQQSLKVLGTVFNINAYEEEGKTSTTLLEGKVAVRSNDLQGTKSATLAPGQQSILEETGLRVVPVDVQDAIAWREGKFLFSHSDIYSVMRQIARWYDVEIIYEGDLSAVLFTGSMSRFADIHTVVQNLELTREIELNIQGRRVVVKKR
ncbi:FecR family protein [Sphingobacterium tabacisoli]|uniref:FecR family protein n=1 Tax=Sphingobacterium tabacisoli TaxID=2044855 RepID=A0ABW5L469_9SPHI|nr:FecR domain-containing protein [Sphingobacterium tabacisoli]